MGKSWGNNVLKRLYALKSLFNGWMSVVVIAMILSTILVQFEFNYFENKLYDLRQQHDLQLPVDSRIVLTIADRETSQQLQEPYPLPLKYHTHLLSSLLSYQPAAIGYLTNLSQSLQSTQEYEQKKIKTQFLKVSKMLQKNQIPLILGAPEGSIDPPSPFLGIIPQTPTSLPSNDRNHGNDSITRLGPLTIRGTKAFHLKLANLSRLSQASNNSLEASPVLTDEGPSFYFRIHGKNGGKYPLISHLDVMNGAVPKHLLQNKILLVGTSDGDQASDLIKHANILDSILNHQRISKSSDWTNWIVTFLVTTSALGWIMNSTPVIGMIASLILSIGVVLFCQFVFQHDGLWIKESLPLIGILVSYYLAIPYRLIREYKIRWEFQRKNELLTQVEEMKTHFISLITHDLKTPIARIQGLTEITLRAAQKRKNPQELQTLNHLSEAIWELDHFINRVLELNRIESNLIHLQIESKDVNSIIEKVIERFSEVSQSKSVEIQFKLEPLFPIKMDSELIYKVLSNILDNAIKYSPNHSTIRITSQEDTNWVIITIADQGIGMTEDEQNQLFKRFFRAKNDVTATNRGTGLGLYLSKFFIEAHQGQLKVQSKINQGSQFKIYLPIKKTKESKSISRSIKMHFFSTQMKEIPYV